MTLVRQLTFAFITLLSLFSVTAGEAVTADAPKASIVIPPQPPVPAPAPKPVEARLWNLQDADILSVINEVSLETGKNFVVDPRVTGKITLVSSKPIQPEALYQVFLSVLEILGYSAIPDGNVVKIVPNMDSAELATKVANGQPTNGGEVVVRVIPLENVAANQLIPILRPMLPQWSNVSAYAPGNVLILLGRASNLNRIVSVIHRIDQTSANDIDVVPLHHASASQLAIVLTNLQSASRATGDTPQVSIAADERSNSVLLSGNRAARLHMKYLISRLDITGSNTQGNPAVVYLRYLQAKTFAPLLGKIAQNMQGKDSGKDTTEQVTTVVNVNSSTRPGKTPENMTSIQAEPSTNALIITAPPTMMAALNGIIAKLDIRPAQVLVESIIVEVDEGNLKNLGIQWGTLVNSFAQVSPLTAGTTSAQLPSSVTDFPLPGAGNVGIIPHTNIAAILSFLENKSGTNILSTPSITVLDNQKAILEIGQDVPVQTGSYATTGSSSTVTPFNTISTKPVTLKLQVIPQINLGCAVRLIINLKNDSLQNPNSPGLTPIINTSNIQNSVIINSGDVLVLGGLISNSVTETINKVPFFGDIPGVGKYLFQQKDRQIQKKNLMVFIKPTILRTPVDASALSDTKYEAIRNVQINWPEDVGRTIPERAPNVLPLKYNQKELPKPFETMN